MAKLREGEPRWTWQTIAAVTVVLLLFVVGVIILAAVFFGVAKPPPSPEGTYPRGTSTRRSF